MPAVSAKLYELSVMVWKGEDPPSHWLRGILVSIWKTGRYPRSDLDNHRGISLLTWTGKVLSVCLNDRLMKVTQQAVDPAQAGFTPARSCDDVTFAIRRIIEDYIRAPENPLSEFYDVD